MPLMPGTSDATIRQNIAEIMHTRKERGGRMKFGAHGPLKQVGDKKARAIAAARAFDAARESAHSAHDTAALRRLQNR